MICWRCRCHAPFLCFCLLLLKATNEEHLAREAGGILAATSKTSTLYLPVIYLTLLKQIKAERIYPCFISLAAAPTESVLTIAIIIACVVVYLL